LSFENKGNGHSITEWVRSIVTIHSVISPVLPYVPLPRGGPAGLRFGIWLFPPRAPSISSGPFADPGNGKLGNIGRNSFHGPSGFLLRHVSGQEVHYH